MHASSRTPRLAVHTKTVYFRLNRIKKLTSNSVFHSCELVFIRGQYFLRTT